MRQLDNWNVRDPNNQKPRSLLLLYDVTVQGCWAMRIRQLVPTWRYLWTSGLAWGPLPRWMKQGWPWETQHFWRGWLRDVSWPKRGGDDLGTLPRQISPKISTLTIWVYYCRYHVYTAKLRPGPVVFKCSRCRWFQVPSEFFILFYFLFSTVFAQTS